MKLVISASSFNMDIDTIMISNVGDDIEAAIETMRRISKNLAKAGYGYVALYDIEDFKTKLIADILNGEEKIMAT